MLCCACEICSQWLCVYPRPDAPPPPRASQPNLATSHLDHFGRTQSSSVEREMMAGRARTRVSRMSVCRRVCSAYLPALPLVCAQAPRPLQPMRSGGTAGGRGAGRRRRGQTGTPPRDGCTRDPGRLWRCETRLVPSPTPSAKGRPDGRRSVVRPPARPEGTSRARVCRRGAKRISLRYGLSSAQRSLAWAAAYETSSLIRGYLPFSSSEGASASSACRSGDDKRHRQLHGDWLADGSGRGGRRRLNLLLGDPNKARTTSFTAHHRPNRPARHLSTLCVGCSCNRIEAHSHSRLTAFLTSSHCNVNQRKLALRQPKPAGRGLVKLAPFQCALPHE